MSDPHQNDAAELALAARLRVLREAGVSFARFDEHGALVVVRFAIIDGGGMADGETERKPNPVRDAALRLSRAPLAAES